MVDKQQTSRRAASISDIPRHAENMMVTGSDVTNYTLTFEKLKSDLDVNLSKAKRIVRHAVKEYSVSVSVSVISYQLFE